MPSEPPTAAATNGGSTDPAATKPETAADDAVKSGGEADRSYEQRALNELVPDISVGDDDTPGSREGGADPGNDAEADAKDELSDALDEIDDDLLNAFIKIVVSIKAGILLISIGLLVIGFQGMLALGGGLIAVGCLALARAAHRYWNHKQASQQSDNG